MSLFSKFRSIAACYVSGENVYLGFNAQDSAVVPAYVALHKETRKLLACGEEAKNMAGKEPGNISVERVVRFGAPSDFSAAEHFFRYVFKKHLRAGKLVPPAIVLSGNLEHEFSKRAFKEVALAAGARQITLLEAGMATAIGLGLEVENPDYHVILNLENDWLVFSVISLAGVVAQHVEPTGWNSLLRDIAIYSRETLTFEPDIDHLSATLRSEGFDSSAELIGWEAWVDSVETGREKLTAPNSTTYTRACTPTLLMLREAYIKCVRSIPQERRLQLNACDIHLAGEFAHTPGFDRLLAKRLQKNVIVKPNATRAGFDGTLKILPDVQHLIRFVPS